MTFSTLASPGVSLQGGGGSGGGGGGTPGGSNTQIQYNSSGTFAGASGLTTNGTELTIASGTKTADAPVLNMSQTWNNGATTFTGLKYNATDTASAAASLLMDLQVGGSSAFNVSKDGSLKLGRNASGTNVAASNVVIAGSQGTGTGAGGSIIFQVAPAGSSGTAQNALADALTLNSARQIVSAIAGSAATPAYNFLSAGNGLYLSSNSVYLATSGSVVRFGFGTNGAELQSTGVVGWSSSSTDASSAKDLLLFRDAANTLALRNGANAQLLRVYARYDGTNDAYGAMGAAVNLDGTAGDANTLYVGSQKKGSPTALTKLAVQVDGTTRLDYNISNANQWFINGTFQSGGSFFSGGDVRAAVTGSIYWNGRTNITAPADGNLLIGNLAQTDFGRMMFGGTTSSFPALKRSSAILQARLADDSAFAGFASANMQAATAYTVASLPTPSTGMIARVTDALAPTIGATVTGGGAAYALVNYNGANWTVIGI